MTASFDCPNCGAPLSFEPKPGDETVECSFCHDTVIIPKEMRIKRPRVAVDQTPPAAPAAPMNRVVKVFAWIGVIAIIFIIIIIAFPSDTPSSDSPISTDVPTLAVNSPTATFEAKATLDALQPILILMQSWPASFTEKFMDNSHKWEAGDVRDSYITGNRSISDGTYTWNITTVKSASDFSFPDMPDQTDFFASVDMKTNSMPDDTDADSGLVFRYNVKDQTWYYFSVNIYGQYYLGWYDGSSWSTLIPETDSAAIHIGQTNRLTVGAQGSQFIFLINGQMVDHFIDHNLKSGTVGVGVNLPKVGEKANVEFANFSILSPTSSP